MLTGRFCILVLGLVVGQGTVEAVEPAGVVSGKSADSGAGARPERRTIGRLGAGVQLGGFYDLADPALELRGWAKWVGFSLSLGRHVADPSYPDFTDVSSEPGKQFTGGVLLAFVNPRPGRRVPIKVYGTVGIVHTTQARGHWEGVASDGTLGEAGVEGATGTWPFAGAGAEIGFAGLPGLAVSSELVFAMSGDGFGPGVRFAVRYYAW